MQLLFINPDRSSAAMAAAVKKQSQTKVERKFSKRNSRYSPAQFHNHLLIPAFFPVIISQGKNVFVLNTAMPIIVLLFQRVIMSVQSVVSPKQVHSCVIPFCFWWSSFFSFCRTKAFVYCSFSNYAVVLDSGGGGYICCFYSYTSDLDVCLRSGSSTVYLRSGPLPH